ncbi:MAG TPA: class I SAM-dependent methyltransferase [Acidimicrobiales bacterium]|nr:class I SAM-dependent methyltransferase [Acidimicrobiales bacterium]
MNENHAQLCPSPEWAALIHDEVLPALVALADLGEEMLELGPGPGAATDWLRHRVGHLVALESDPVAAARLRERLGSTNVEVLTGDATDTALAAESFDAVGAFTMLHHVATFEGQQRVLAEAYRVLRPGGAFLGSDSLASDGLHHFHEGDTYNPVEPSSFLVRLRAAGFRRVTVMVGDDLRFVAHKARRDDVSHPESTTLKE